MKRLTLLMQVVLIISLPLLFLLTDVQVATFDKDFFSRKYEEYNIMNETGIKKSDLMDVTHQLLTYLKGNREDILIYTEVHGEVEQVFEEREILHLEDVKVLYEKGFFIRNLSLLLVTLSLGFLILFNRKKLPKTMILTSIIPMGLMGILSLLLITDFYRYFTYFHEIFFNNDLWLLNPKTDILIQMYPLDFFNSIGFRIIIMFVVELILLLVIGLMLPKLRFIRRKVRS